MFGVDVADRWCEWRDCEESETSSAKLEGDRGAGESDITHARGTRGEETTDERKRDGGMERLMVSD